MIHENTEPRDRREGDQPLSTGSPEENEIFRIIFEHSPLAIMHTDRNGVIRRCNRNATRVFGAPEEKLIGFSYESIRDQKMKAAIAVALSGKTSHFIGEYVTVTGNVKTFMNASFSPSFSQDGAVSGVIGIFEDISARRNAETSLKELQERFELAIHTSPDSICITKMDGTYVDSNEGFTDLSGYTREEVIGKTTADIRIWDSPEDRERLFRELRKTGRVKNLEFHFRLKDGSHKIALMSANIIQLHGEDHVLSVTKDITQLRKAENDRQQLLEQLHQSQKIESVGVLAGGIAHDFNNLLLAILGNIGLSLLHVAPENKVHSYLKEAERASLRARDVTQQLLTFSRGGRPVKKVTSLPGIVRDAAEFVLRGSGIRCTYRFQEELHPVAVDAGQIGQVVQNIVMNARQAMPAGGAIEIVGENFIKNPSHVLPLADGRYIRLSIEDSGGGIPADLLHKVFDPYVTTKQKASGLGLAVSYSIINKHLGYIDVSSEPGVSTTFTIYLPALDQDRADGLPRDKALPVSGKGSVLVMDDEEIVRNVVQSMLEQAGYTVLLAKDGEEAVDIFQRSVRQQIPIDIVIMDIIIPGGMGGEDAVKKILAIDPDAKVIVSSGYSSDPIMSDHARYGFRDAVAKPFQLQDLLDSISRIKGNG